MSSTATPPIPPASPALLTVGEAADYIRRTPKAMYRLRARRVGPPSFKTGHRVMYRLSALDAWLAAQEAADSRSNPALDPTRVAPEPSRAKGRRRSLTA
ncbi:helix-turn-helix domain-containing protein [Kitasatospora sp. NPDC050543]|uniref:helix-turn-helix domain-containing protein n=1 Tax=Kitasatospora sp. NPDC050543 TaxID=3364054 RepID=UPI00378B5750